MAAAAAPVCVRVNPNNAAQRYRMWGNGRIDAEGGAVPITGQGTWYDSPVQPIAVAFNITDWLTGAGHQLDRSGGTHAFNGAATLGTAGVMAGVPYAAGKAQYIDWAWDPAGTGQGYVLTVYGQLLPFGGASAPSRTGPMWTQPFARKLKMRWTPDKRAIVMDLYGGLHREFALTGFVGPIPYWPRFDAARDFVVADWTIPTGYTLDLYGAIHGFGGVANPSGVPTRRGADVGRTLHLLSASNPLSFWVSWAQGQEWDVVSSTPPTVVAGGGVNEVQTIAVTGAPTAGTWSATYVGQTASALSRTITAAALQTALRALSSIGSTGVTVTGGPAGTAPLAVEFTGTLATTDVAAITVAHTFTGGTAPTVTVTPTTQGIAASPAASVTTTTRPNLAFAYSDPQNDQMAEARVLAFTQAWVDSHTMTDPLLWASNALVNETLVDPAARGVVSPVDFTNGTFRMYVRAKDTAGQWSAWSNRGWTQAVPLPTTPTGLTASSPLGTWRVDLSVTAATGGSANMIQFQFSTDGVTWNPVRGLEAVPLLATTTAVDRDPPLGLATAYRALAYNNAPRVVSLPSGTATATALPMRHVFTSTSDPALGGEVLVTEAPSWERPIEAGIFEPVGNPYAVVVDDGSPKSRRFPVTLDVDKRVEWDKISALLTGTMRAGGLLVWRDPFGDVVYCKAVGSWRRTQRRLPAYPDETTPLRHNHVVELNLVEVSPPYLLPTATAEPPEEP